MQRVLKVFSAISIGHPAGDFARTQSADSVGDCSDGTENEPVVFTFGLPEPDGILIVMTDRPS